MTLPALKLSWARHEKPLPKLPVSLLILALAGCKEDEEISYTLFNCEDDYTTIQVGIDEVISGSDCGGDNGTIELRSSTCEADIGTATLTPCGGPIDTEHSIVVRVDSNQSHQIAKVTARLDSGDRGEDEYRLNADSADPGLYKITLISVGSEDEIRDDLVTIRLWKEDPVAEDDS